MLDKVRLLHERVVAVLMVEQVITSALAVADYVYVMGSGQIVAEGPAADMEPAELERRYLGGSL
jgi:ABC-type branched-subunit amino acid transport system ATPase component